MRLGGRGGDKIIIKRNANRHDVFCSVRDDADNGTIINFIQTRRRIALDEVRKELRPWIRQPPSPPLPYRSFRSSSQQRRTTDASKPNSHACSR